MYLMKKNPEEPFGDFFLSTVFNELSDQDNKYATNTLEFEEDGSHCTYEFKTSQCKTDQLVQTLKPIKQKQQAKVEESATQNEDHQANL